MPPQVRVPQGPRAASCPSAAVPASRSRRSRSRSGGPGDDRMPPHRPDPAVRDRARRRTGHRPRQVRGPGTAAGRCRPPSAWRTARLFPAARSRVSGGPVAGGRATVAGPSVRDRGPAPSAVGAGPLACSYPRPFGLGRTGSCGRPFRRDTTDRTHHPRTRAVGPGASPGAWIRTRRFHGDLRCPGRRRGAPRPGTPQEPDPGQSRNLGQALHHTRHRRHDRPSEADGPPPTRLPQPFNAHSPRQGSPRGPASTGTLRDLPRQTASPKGNDRTDAGRRTPARIRGNGPGIRAGGLG